VQSHIEGAQLVTRRSWRAAIYAAWDRRCAYCGAPAQSLDHIIPRCQGGLTVRSNLAPACLCCNRRKGHQQWQDWWRQQPSWNLDAEARLQAWMVADGDRWGPVV
jgi:5-methylcytosine-specific restriction endonuclease McrA